MSYYVYEMTAADGSALYRRRRLKYYFNFGRGRTPGHHMSREAWDAAAWRAVAITFAADAADAGTYLPTDPAILAYNHARNGRYAEALEVLA